MSPISEITIQLISSPHEMGFDSVRTLSSAYLSISTILYPCIKPVDKRKRGLNLGGSAGL